MASYFRGAEETKKVVDDPRELALPDSQFVELLGCRVHFRTSENLGKRAKTGTLVMVHGFSGCTENWRSVWNSFPDYHVVALDLPGWGRSSRLFRRGPSWADTGGENPYSLRYQARLLLAFLKALHLEQNLVLMAHSYGGAVAAHACLLEPELAERLKGLVLVSAALGDGWPVPKAVSALAKAFPPITELPALIYGSAMELDVMMRVPFHNLKAFVKEEPCLLRGWDVLTSVTHWERALSEWMVHNAPRVPLDAERLHAAVPAVLEIRGAKDLVISTKMRLGGDSALLKRSGHFPFVDERDEFVFLVDSWLSASVDWDAPASSRGEGMVLRASQSLVFAVDAILVLGAPTTPEGTPGPDLQQRLESALEFVRARPRSLLVVSGGKPQTYGSAGVRTEAEASEEWLRQQGYQGDVICESEAKSTLENLQNVRELLKNKLVDKLFIVTHAWHMERALLLAEHVFLDADVDVRSHPVPGEASEERMQTEQRLIAFYKNQFNK